MDWDKLKTFYTVAETGSFSAAQEPLRRSQSALSRQVATLEETLDVQLFHRHARGLKLTEQGELLRKTVEDILEQVSVAEMSMQEGWSTPRGPLKISTTAAFGAFFLAPRLNLFCELYPEITVTLLIDDGKANLSVGEADVVIRSSPPEQSELIQRRLFSWSCGAYASPDYLRCHGIPQHPQDLDHHHLITLGRDPDFDALAGRWLLDLGADPDAPRRSRAAIGDVHCLQQAASAGLGIVALPSIVTPALLGLAPVLPTYSSPMTNIYFSYAACFRKSKKIAALRDFLVRSLDTVDLT